MNAHKSITQGMTLVELIIAISIIAILLSILITSLGSVRNKAAIASSLSNLRSIGSAITLYANDNQNTLPGPMVVGIYPEIRNDPVKTWTMSWYLREYISSTASANNADYRIFETFVSPLSKDSRTSSNILAPGYQVVGGIKTESPDVGDFNSIDYNVGFRFGLSNWGGARNRHPQRLLSLDDANLSCGWITDSSIGGDTTFYKGQRTWLFPDGSVEIRPSSQFPAFKSQQKLFEKLL